MVVASLTAALAVSFFMVASFVTLSAATWQMACAAAFGSYVCGTFFGSLLAINRILHLLGRLHKRQHFEPPRRWGLFSGFMFRIISTCLAAEAVEAGSGGDGSSTVTANLVVV